MGSEKTADEIRFAFQSLNERDSNGETANVVDGLFAIARSLSDVAEALFAIQTELATTKHKKEA